MEHRFGWLWAALIVFVCVGYQYLVHSALVGDQTETMRIVLAFLPLLALAFWIVTRSRNKPLWMLILVVACMAIYVLRHQADWGLPAAYGLPHAVIYMSLLWLFGHTLLPGRQPLITRIARRVHGTLSQDMEIYTRGVTAAWCVFFVAQLITSVLLFTLAPLRLWSLYINFLNLPLLTAMFIGEYAYRVSRHRNFPHASLLKSIQAFAKDSAPSKSVEAR